VSVIDIHGEPVMVSSSPAASGEAVRRHHQILVIQWPALVAKYGQDKLGDCVK